MRWKTQADKPLLFINNAPYTLLYRLSPMCTGAILLYGIPKVVIGENKTFQGSEALLKEHGVEVVVLNNQECIDLMNDFIAAKPALWNEDIGE